MFRKAFRSYIATLRFKNIKKLRDSEMYGYIAVLFLILYASSELIHKNGIGDLNCSVLLRALLPMGFMGISNLGSKYLMPKVMFLCPMKESDRKEYLKYVFLIKIGAIVVVSFFTELIWGLYFGFKWWELIMVPFLFASIGIAEYVEIKVKQFEAGHMPNIVEDKDGNKVAIWMNTVLAVFIVLLLGFISAYDIKQITIQHEQEAQIWIIVMIICMIGIVVFDYLIIKTQYKYVIEQSTDYELHFRIKGNMKKR